MRNKLLLITDPQVDFIIDSLPVPGAERTMNALATYVRNHGSEYSHIIITADRHPMRHCSFKTEGGEWPIPCVSDSSGAAIWPPIMDVVLNNPDKITILHKGKDASREEYSIFKNCVATDRILQVLETGNVQTYQNAQKCGLIWVRLTEHPS